MPQTYAQLFNENPATGWGIDAREFNGRRSRRSRAAAVDKRRERIVSLGAGRVAAMLDELASTLLPIRSRLPVNVVFIAVDSFKDAVIADLVNAAMVAHLSATAAAYLEAGIELSRRPTVVGFGRRMLSTKVPGRGWTSQARASRSRTFATTIEEAESFVKARAKLTDDQVEAIKAAYAERALDLGAGVVTPQARARLEATVARIIGENLHVADGKKLIAETLDSLGLTPKNPFTVEAIVRTQVQLAYSAASVHADRDPAIAEILWGYEYSTVGDDRVRPTHAGLDGLRLPKEDPRWRSLMPPNGFACRCTALRIFSGEAAAKVVPPEAEVEIDGKKVVPGADPGWTFNPGDVLDAIAAVSPSPQ